MYYWAMKCFLIEIETHSTEGGNCFYCNRQGGAPVLMTGDGEFEREFVRRRTIRRRKTRPAAMQCRLVNVGTESAAVVASSS